MMMKKSIFKIYFSELLCNSIADVVFSTRVELRTVDGLGFVLAVEFTLTF